MENVKRNISVRLSTSDKKKMKEISNRLGVKESEIFRYAVKDMLTKLMPLSDEKLTGSDLIPAWLECGRDLLNYFHIDIDQLNNIFNGNAEDDDKRIDLADLDLMVLSSLNQKYVVKKLSEICKSNVDPVDVNDVLKRYLYEKYIVGDISSSHTVNISSGKTKPSVMVTN